MTLICYIQYFCNLIILLFYPQKHEILRLEVLQKSEKLLKNKDLPWEDRDLGTTVSNLLRTVVESYDGWVS